MTLFTDKNKISKLNWRNKNPHQPKPVRVVFAPDE